MRTKAMNPEGRKKTRDTFQLLPVIKTTLNVRDKLKTTCPYPVTAMATHSG